MALFKKSPLTSSRLAQRKRRIFAAKIIFYIVFAGLAVYGAVWFSRQSDFQIASVEVSGNVSVDTFSIQEIASRDISGSYFFLFPRSNKFIYPQKKIESDILSRFPEIASAKVTIQNQAMGVSVVERTPAYVWCKGLPENMSSDCYFMDEGGYIFSIAPVFSLSGQAGNAYFTYYGMIEKENPIGLSYLNLGQFGFLNSVREGFEKSGVSVFAENSKPDGVREFYLSKGGRIILKNTQSPDSLVGAIGLIKSQTEILNQSAAPLDYLDMRFGNKVYYKFVGDNAVLSPQ